MIAKGVKEMKERFDSWQRKRKRNTKYGMNLYAVSCHSAKTQALVEAPSVEDEIEEGGGVRERGICFGEEREQEQCFESDQVQGSSLVLSSIIISAMFSGPKSHGPFVECLGI